MFNRTTLKLSQRETFYIFPSCCIATGWFHRSLQSLGFCIHVYKHGVQPFIYCFYLKKNLFSSYPSLPDILFTQFGPFFLAYSELLKEVCVYVCVCNNTCSYLSLGVEGCHSEHLVSCLLTLLPPRLAESVLTSLNCYHLGKCCYPLYAGLKATQL